MNTNTVIKVHGREITVPPELAQLSGQGAGIRTVFEAGAWAAALGCDETTCKYKPGRGSGARRNAWLRGFRAWKEAHPPRTRAKEAVA